MNQNVIAKTSQSTSYSARAAFEASGRNQVTEREKRGEKKGVHKTDDFIFVFLNSFFRADVFEIIRISSRKNCKLVLVKIARAYLFTKYEGVRATRTNKDLG